MSRAFQSAFLFSFALASLLGAPRAAADGYEVFANFPVTANSYSSGTFAGRDGSTWTYTLCQGSKVITAPTPGLKDGTTGNPSIASGVIAGGCGTLSFDWMKMFSKAVSVDVIVNDAVLHTITGGTQNVVNNTGLLDVNAGGSFTLQIRQNNKDSGQVAIDNIRWTSFGGSAPAPPALTFNPNVTNVAAAYGNLIQFTVRATEPNDEPNVRLWSAGLPAGAIFNAITGAAPLVSTFSWTPTSAQTGTFDVAFFAADKDGTNSRTFSIEVTPIYPYYHYAEGLTGAALEAKLHDIISTGALQLTTTDQMRDAMKDIHTDPNNADNVLLLYNPTSSVPKSLCDKDPGWNKEHCWPDSRGLENGPDGVDIHNLYAEEKYVNEMRGALFYDDSDPADHEYVSSVTNTAPATSRDSNSWEPPDASKGNVARAIFYMATRYDGTEPETAALGFANAPTVPNISMGILTTLLRWHAADPPDDWERTRNELIHSRYQHNRNPFVDRPEWAEKIWGTNNVPPQFVPVATQQVATGSRLSFEVRALPTGGDPVALAMSNAPAGAAFHPTNEIGTFVWTPVDVGMFSVDFYAADIDGTARQTVWIDVTAPTQSILLVRYDFEDAATNFTAAPSQRHALLGASAVAGSTPPVAEAAGNPGKAISDSGWNVADLTAFFTFTLTPSNGHELVLTRLTFADQASNSGAKNWQLRSSLDDYAAPLGSGSTHTSFASNTVNLANLSLTNGSVTFRIHGQNATNASGTWRLDNLRLSGYLLPLADGTGDDDSDGVSNTDEAIAGTDPGNSNSVFQASLSGTDLDLQIGCGLLTSGSTWRLYQGLYTNGGIDWRQVAQTNHLQGGALRFDILPTNSAAFYHLRATRP